MMTGEELACILVLYLRSVSCFGHWLTRSRLLKKYSALMATAPGNAVTLEELHKMGGTAAMQLILTIWEETAAINEKMQEELQALRSTGVSKVKGAQVELEEFSAPIAVLKSRPDMIGKIARSDMAMVTTPRGGHSPTSATTAGSPTTVRDSVKEPTKGKPTKDVPSSSGKWEEPKKVKLAKESAPPLSKEKASSSRVDNILGDMDKPKIIGQTGQSRSPTSSKFTY